MDFEDGYYSVRLPQSNRNVVLPFQATVYGPVRVTKYNPDGTVAEQYTVPVRTLKSKPSPFPGDDERMPDGSTKMRKQRPPELSRRRDEDLVPTVSRTRQSWGRDWYLNN